MMKLPRKHGFSNDENEEEPQSAEPLFPTLEIEKDIPIPDRQGTLGIRWRTWPFERMEAGDSFLLRCKKDEAKKKYGSINSALLRYRKEHPEQRFTCRTIEGGVRCWRVQ